MSVPSHKTHLGFSVHIDELVEEHALTMRSATHESLIKTQDAVTWTIDNLTSKLRDAEAKVAELSKPKEEKK